MRIEKRGVSWNVRKVSSPWHSTSTIIKFSILVTVLMTCLSKIPVEYCYHTTHRTQRSQSKHRKRAIISIPILPPVERMMPASGAAKEKRKEKKERRQKGEHSKATRKRAKTHSKSEREREQQQQVKWEPKEVKAKARRKTHKDIDDPQQHPKRPAANPLSPWAPAPRQARSPPPAATSPREAKRPYADADAGTRACWEAGSGAAPLMGACAPAATGSVRTRRAGGLRAKQAGRASWRGA